MASVPEVMVFFNRPAGSMVMNALLQAAMTESNDPHAAVPYADVGDRFGVSRAHVRGLLIAAQDAGLVNLHPRNAHRVEILPRCGLAPTAPSPPSPISPTRAPSSP